MILLAAIAFGALVIQFVLALLSAVGDQNHTPVITWLPVVKKKKDGEEITHRRIVSLERRELSEPEKRKRFMWFALSPAPAILFITVYLILQFLH